jgi:hypothetical protein
LWGPWATPDSQAAYFNFLKAVTLAEAIMNRHKGPEGKYSASEKEDIRKAFKELQPHILVAGQEYKRQLKIHLNSNRTLPATLREMRRQKNPITRNWKTVSTLFKGTNMQARLKPAELAAKCLAVRYGDDGLESRLLSGKL